MLCSYRGTVHLYCVCRYIDDHVRDPSDADITISATFGSELNPSHWVTKQNTRRGHRTRPLSFQCVGDEWAVKHTGQHHIESDRDGDVSLSVIPNNVKGNRFHILSLSVETRGGRKYARRDYIRNLAYEGGVYLRRKQSAVSRALMSVSQSGMGRRWSGCLSVLTRAPERAQCSLSKTVARNTYVDCCRASGDKQ